MSEEVGQNLVGRLENKIKRLDIPFLSNISFLWREIAHKLGFDKIAESKNLIYSPCDFNDILEFYGWFKYGIRNYPYLFEATTTKEELNNQQNFIIKHMFKVDSFVIAIRNKKNLAVLGCVKMLTLDDGDEKPDIYTEDDFILTIYLSPEVLNSNSKAGIGTESIKTMLKSIFLDSEKRKVMLRVDYRNITAIKCYMKCGFLPYLPHYLKPNIKTWFEIIEICESENNNIYPKGLITMMVNREMVQRDIGDNYESTNYRAATQYKAYFQALNENTQQNP